MSSLINSYSAANRVVDTALAIRYSKTRITGVWSFTNLSVTTTWTEAWSYMRTATKSYRYVGMTLAAARTCAAEMRTKYQRDTKYSKWSPNATTQEFKDESGGSMAMADVALNRVGGGMYEVVISVNETDSKIRLADAAFAGLFAAENNRDYDED